MGVVPVVVVSFLLSLFCIRVFFFTSCSDSPDQSWLSLLWFYSHSAELNNIHQPLNLNLLPFFSTTLLSAHKLIDFQWPFALTGCCGSTAHTAVCCDWPSPAAWTQAGRAGPSVRSQTSHCWRQRCWQLGSSLLDAGEAWGRKGGRMFSREKVECNVQ